MTNSKQQGAQRGRRGQQVRKHSYYNHDFAVAMPHCLSCCVRYVLGLPPNHNIGEMHVAKNVEITAIRAAALSTQISLGRMPSL